MARWPTYKRADVLTETVRRSPELEAIARRWLHAMLSQRLKTAVSLFSQSDALTYIGSDENEYWAGDALRLGYVAHLREANPAVTSNLEVEAWEGGAFGWARLRVQVQFEDAERPIYLRQTLVFLLEEGIWKVVHLHNSNPVPNIEAFGYAHRAFDALLATIDESDLRLGKSGSATVMFTDIVGSSALAEAIGDVRWAAIVALHVKTIEALLEQHAGRLVKTMGDGTMSTFTAAGQALRAAMAVQRSMDEMVGEPRISLRVGLNTGDIVQAGDDFIGTVVNKAARIAAAAQPGEIRVSDATKAMVGNAVDYTFTAPATVQLKGLVGDHTLYRLEWRT